MKIIPNQSQSLKKMTKVNFGVSLVLTYKRANFWRRKNLPFCPLSSIVRERQTHEASGHKSNSSDRFPKNSPIHMNRAILKLAPPIGRISQLVHGGGGKSV